MVALFPVAFLGSYMVLMVLEVFIPMMGRTGQAENPEAFIAAIVSLIAVSFTLYTVSSECAMNHNTALRGSAFGL